MAGYEEYALTGKDGLLCLIDGIPLILKKHDADFEGDSMDLFTSDGTPWKFPKRTGQTMTCTIEGMSVEAKALLTNATLTSGAGYVYHKNEAHDSSSDAFTLTNIPILANSLEIFRRTDDLTTGEKYLKLKQVTSGPGTDEFSVNVTTGVVTLNAATTDGDTFYCNYAENSSAEGRKLVHNFSPDNSSHVMVIGEGIVNLETGDYYEDGHLLYYPSISITKRPKLTGSMEDIEDGEFEVTVISPPVETYQDAV